MLHGRAYAAFPPLAASVEKEAPMNELDPAQTASDTQAIAEFCQYEHVTITQVDAQKVKATFQDIFGCHIKCCVMA